MILNDAAYSDGSRLTEMGTVDQFDLLAHPSSDLASAAHEQWMVTLNLTPLIKAPIDMLFIDKDYEIVRTEPWAFDISAAYWVQQASGLKY